MGRLNAGPYTDPDFESGVASDNKIYFSSEHGVIYVVQAGSEYKLLSVNPVGDLCMATPALDKNNIYFRTQHFVIAIGE
ncbi:MAG: hypothetical protein J7L96_11200 [Bacteroidales bacterium]|nr:hypothetical protein [Bacteroidales bacterium]